MFAVVFNRVVPLVNSLVNGPGKAVSNFFFLPKMVTAPVNLAF